MYFLLKPNEEAADRNAGNSCGFVLVMNESELNQGLLQHWFRCDIERRFSCEKYPSKVQE